jgi:hypothetical protein
MFTRQSKAVKCLDRIRPPLKFQLGWQPTVESGDSTSRCKRIRRRRRRRRRGTNGGEFTGLTLLSAGIRSMEGRADVADETSGPTNTGRADVEDKPNRRQYVSMAVGRSADCPTDRPTNQPTDWRQRIMARYAVRRDAGIWLMIGRRITFGWVRQGCQRASNE